MKEYKTSNIRNVAVLGHMGSGKTSMGEALLFVTKAIDKKGEVERKTTVGDYSLEEQNRQTTLMSSLLPCEWKNNKINFLDTPGSEEFIGDISNVLSVADGAVVLIDATKGVEVGTERVWEELSNRKIPTIIFVNKMDKENVKFDEVIDSITSKLSKNATPFAWPVGETNNFGGFINLLNKKAVLFNGLDCKEGPIPPVLTAKVEEINGQLLEKVAEATEELMEKYFSGEELTAEEIRQGLKIEVSASELFPILVGAGLKNVGVDALLDMIVDFLPAPNERPLKEGLNTNNETVKREMSENAPLAGYVFKTTIDPFVGTISFFKLYAGSLKVGQEVFIPSTGSVVKITQLFTVMGKTQLPIDSVSAGDIACVAKVSEFYNGLTFCDKKDPIVYPKNEHANPIIYVAIQPKNKNDEDKLSGSLQKLKLEDETFEIVRNPETAQQLIGGQGMTHIGYILEKMKNMFKVEIDVSDPKIVYRETIKAKGEAQGRHKKQSGGAGQFGDVWIRFEPCKEDFIFAEEVVGGAVPKNYFPAVEKGLIETLEHGPLAGFPVIGIKATLFYGSYHPVDSNEISFKLAAGLAFKNAIDKIKPTILEPICEVNVTVKDEFVGDIMGDMTKRRGRVLGMEQGHGMQTIIAEVPEAEIVKYATDLKAMTQASGRFTRKFVRYEEVPEMLIKKIIEEYKKEK
ncbi:MAG TPA: elongation factor G [Bacilli bacterium]|jgi:elongation factor G|nr:elongation factor G [Bacilli bacterium]HOH61365.1 elongation factor G [Bacilli bacterium]HPB49441.1 elongation factor G [Bacilli bacterium]HPM14972.1 elongation factor G [Bacilli bacterium]HPY54749.1 elongation factor G [Bacilli bacterium]